MRTSSVSFSVSALQPHRWAVGRSYHRSRISLFFRIANAEERELQSPCSLLTDGEGDRTELSFVDFIFIIELMLPYNAFSLLYVTNNSL